MENKEKDLNKASKNLPIILVGVAIVVAIIVIALAMQKKNDISPAGNQQGQQDQNGQIGEDTGDVAVNASTPSGNLQQVEVPNVGTAQVVIPGANPITSDNVVVTASGEATVNEGMTAGENAPRQTGFLNAEELPTEVPQLLVGKGRISPNQLITTAGSPTTFAWTSTDDDVHIFGFTDQSLSAISILVGPGQTKAITFNAPANPGSYEFRCTSPTHAGETGTLIVK